MPWQAAFPELRQYSGYAWYRRTLEVDAAFLEGAVRLHFGAVDYWCQVWVNETLVGEHEGGYTPFGFQIGTLLRPGQNTVTLRVYDSAQESLVTHRWHDPLRERDAATSGPPFDAQHIPHGKQEWYINVGGIWQDVTLTALPQTFVERLRVTPNIDSGSAKLDIQLAGSIESNSGKRLRVAILDGETEVVTQTLALVAGQATYQASLAIPQTRLWSLEDPHLYTAQAWIEADDDPPAYSTRFGMRAFTTRDGQFLLNGEPIYLLSALDQDLYPDTIYTVPSEAYLRDQFAKAKELGLNNLRCHIKPPDPLYLDLADEMGLLIWAEVPSWRTFWNKGTIHAGQLDIPEELKARVEETLTGIVDRDFNHPSLVIWTIVNEDWGTALPLSADDRAWVRQMYDLCKQLDPTRLVVDNSACGGTWGPNIHVKSDIDDFHVYTVIPDQARTWSQTIKQFGLRPLWTYSSHGDAQRRGDEPLVLSEFGNWGLPSLAALREHHAGEPPWFDLGPWWSGWSGEPGWPAGVEERFGKLGLDAIWGDYETFATATQMHQYDAMKFEIEAMRREPAIAGYVITEFTDAYWESNGLLDFARNPKAYHHLFKMFNSPDVVVPITRRHNYWADDHASVRLYVSSYSGDAADGTVLHWQVEGTAQAGELTLPPIARGAVHSAGTIRVALHGGEETGMTQVLFELRTPAGQELARNVLDLVVYPATARTATLTDPVSVVSSEQSEPVQIETPALEAVGAEGTPPAIADTVNIEESEEADSHLPSLRSLVQRAGYRTTNHLSPEVRIAISNSPSAELLQWVRKGGNLLFLSEGASPFFFAQGRSGAYSGSWITSYSWIRPEAHPRLLPSNPLGLAYTGIMPLSTIVGLPMDAPGIQADILAGMVSGWIHHPAAHTVQFRYGQGRVIMTTFRLRASLGLDATGTTMLHDLLEYIGSDRCRPILQANY